MITRTAGQWTKASLVALKEHEHWRRPWVLYLED
jgi:hypothetical protein